LLLECIWSRQQEQTHILTKRFSFSKTSRPALSLPSTLFDTHRGGSSQRVKRSGLEGDKLLNLRMRGAIPLLPLMPSLRLKGQLCLYIYIQKYEPTQLCLKWNDRRAFPPQWYKYISQYCLSCVMWLLVLEPGANFIVYLLPIPLTEFRMPAHNVNYLL